MTCHQVKSLDEFNVRSAAKDRRQARCRQCSRAWYVEHREEHLMNVARRSKFIRDEYRDRLGQFLREHPCVDCGEGDLRVLEFDHRDGKEKLETVGRLIGLRASWKRIEAEMRKCEIRCANCHRRRTAEQWGWWRHVVQIASPRGEGPPASCPDVPAAPDA